jgi:cytochrome c-type biogenesis protein CcmH/NrfF
MRPLNLRLKRCLGMALLSLAVFAFLGADEARFNNLGHKLMCVCGCNQVLLECNHVGCTVSGRMRDELAANLDRGDSDDLVLQASVQKYGPTVLLAPTATGFDRVAWIMPYLVLVLGLTVVVVIVRGWNGGGRGDGGGTGSSTGDPGLERFREQARKDTDI